MNIAKLENYQKTWESIKLDKNLSFIDNAVFELNGYFNSCLSADDSQSRRFYSSMINAIKYLIKKIVGKFGYRITLIPRKTVTKQIFNERIKDEFHERMKSDFKDVEKEFEKIYKQCKEYTMTSKERMYALCQAVKYVVNLKLPGDFVECGVWRGGSSMLIASTLLELGITDRKIYLYDTFTGMSEPTEKDWAIMDDTYASAWLEGNRRKECIAFAFCSLGEVKEKMLLTGYPQDNLVFVEGKVEDTIPNMLPSHISLLRLDTDWFESTYHELKYLFPLLSLGGVVIIDDYGHWAGAKEAVNKYFSENHISILLNRIDYAGRLGIKFI